MQRALATHSVVGTMMKHLDLDVALSETHTDAQVNSAWPHLLDGNQEELFCEVRALNKKGRRCNGLPEALENGEDLVPPDSKMEEIGYDVTSYTVTESLMLEASGVVPAWPSWEFTVVLVPGCFLSEDNLEDVHHVQRCLEPGVEWPEAPLLARVLATDREWWSIAWAGLERGLTTTVSENDVLRDHNGPMAVPMTKKASNGGTIQLQRFVANLVPLSGT